MYPNFTATLHAERITHIIIAELLGVHVNTVGNKLNGGMFGVDEALKIWEILLPKYDIKWLFRKVSEQETA